MIKNTCISILILFLTISNFLSANLEYDVQDIGTLQTHSSQAIAINNQGQILGWYNIDGSKEGKHFFVRDHDGSFHEVPSKENGVGWEINWRYLTNDGRAYGTFDGNANFAVLYTWDQQSGVIKLGNLPGKEISAINDAGQVLIKSVVENEGGKSIRRPVIWQNGTTTKLKGLEGDLGIESDESYGYDMNNNGDVVGQSRVFISYKNTIYKQIHAVKWTNGQALDLHKKLPKSNESCVKRINDNGDILATSNGNLYLIENNGSLKYRSNVYNKLNNNGCVYCEQYVLAIDGTNLYLGNLNRKLQQDYDSPWMTIDKIICVNDNGEILAEGKTIYGEQHAILLVPVKGD